MLRQAMRVCVQSVRADKSQAPKSQINEIITSTGVIMINDHVCKGYNLQYAKVNLVFGS